MKLHQNSHEGGSKLNRPERLALLNAVLQSIPVKYKLFAPSVGSMWKKWGMQTEEDWRQRVDLDQRNVSWALSQYKITLRVAYRAALEFAEQEEVSRCN